MSQRHAIACAALQTPDLIQLAKWYIEAIEDCIKEQKNPYKDGACRLIAYQISFAGNGDCSFYPYAEKTMARCIEITEQDSLDITEEVIEDEQTNQAS